MMSHATKLYHLRAPSYKTGNRAGSLRGTNFIFCSCGKFQHGYRVEKGVKGDLFNPKTLRMSLASMDHFDFYSTKQSNNWLSISWRNWCNGGYVCQRSHSIWSATLLSIRIWKRFVSVLGWSVYMGKISSLVTDIPVGKTKISVTGPACFIIWTHGNFGKGDSGEVRSQTQNSPVNWVHVIRP